MNLLRVVYSMDIEKKRVKPYVEEIRSNGADSAKVLSLVFQLENALISEDKKEMAKCAIYASYYIMLMNKGYSYEDILEILKNEVNRKIELGKKKEIMGLREEIELLNIAHEEKENIFEYLFVSNLSDVKDEDIFPMVSSIVKNKILKK